LFEEIITRLLQGQFICEASAPSLFRQLDTESYRDDVDQYLARINRRLSVTPNGQGYYATWLRVGPDQRAEAKRVEAAREVVDIPVAGGFVPAVFTALGLSGRFSILTLSQSTLAMQRSHARAYGVDGALASVRQLNCSPDDLNHTELVVNKALEQALRAVKEDGAEAIVLGHTGLIQVARRVSELLEDIRAQSDKIIVADIYDPMHLEQLEQA